MNKLRFALCVCFLISVTTCLASCGTGTKAMTEYSLPTSFSIPQGITAGPDGNIWFAETHNNKIGRITPSGRLTEYRVPA